MTEYTSTREGYQRAMEASLSGRPEDTHKYVEMLSTSKFYHVLNGRRLSYDAYLDGIAEWRSKVSEWKPVVHQFLRDGDQLSARLTGTIKVDSTNAFFESFMFAKVEQESGKLEWLIERSVWGPLGGESDQKVN